MSPHLGSRRQFLKASAATTMASLLSSTWVRAEEVTPGSKLKLRFAVASDLHYGQPNTPFENMADQLVGWLNKEKTTKGLDAVFINGDLSNDSPAALLTLRDKHLTKLTAPYYAIKGNHDFIDQKPGSPTESWQKLWGYPSNHTVTLNDFAFIMADTSAPSTSSSYLAADIDWLKTQLDLHAKAPAVFVLIHIQQRRHGVDGWPKHGVSAADQIQKAEAVMDLLEATANVRAVFHGHNHLETSVYISDERRYFFDSHTGGSWGAKRGYRIVEVYDDLKMVTYQVNAEDDLELNRHELPVSAKAPQK